jgi:ADP-heptose:LPS heptosyltransferase
MSIEAMKQVLKAWDAYDGGTLDHPIAAAMEALRTAIEQAERDWSLLEATQESLREHMAEIKRLKQRQWDAVPDAFNEWWDADYDDTGNPYRKDSPAYWAWAGWSAANKEKNK